MGSKLQLSIEGICGLYNLTIEKESDNLRIKLMSYSIRSRKVFMEQSKHMKQWRKITVRNTPFLILSITFTILLSKIHVSLTTLCGIHF